LDGWGADQAGGSSGGRGGTGLESLDFRVNHPPVAHAGPDRTVDQGSQVSFDASDSRDVEAPLFAYEWLFHDGSTVTGLTAERDYPEDGDYPVTLTVIDTAGSTASHTITVTVTNVAPTVLTATDVTGVEGSAVQFVATFTDPGVLDTHSALIDWGDGATSVGMVSGSSLRPQISFPSRDGRLSSRSNECRC